MTRCPPRDLLDRFLEDRLDDVQRDTISRHVDGCEECQAALEKLTRNGSVAEAEASPRPQLPRSVASLGDSHSAFLVQLKENLSWRLPASGNGSQGGLAPAGAAGSSPTTFPTVANYQILAELGRGGMGVVYKARQVSLNRLVALKMILAGPHGALKDQARFRQEAEAVAGLRHPNIIQIYDIGEADGRPFLALEFVEGDSLAHLLQGVPQPCNPAARLTETLARAIHYAHQQGIVHRDLKPANVLLQTAVPFVPPEKLESTEAASRQLEAAIPKITDFGLAKRLDGVGGDSQADESAGTPSYMAPEQAVAGAHAVGPAADVYALGAIFYELLTGRPPFRGPTPLDTVVQVVHEEPARPSSLRPDLPRDLEIICLKCLAKEPAKRYATALALADDLYRFRHGKPILARPVGVHERVWKWAKRRPLAASLLAGMLVVAVLGFAGITWQWQEARLARDDEKEHRLKADKAREFARKKLKEAIAARTEAETQQKAAEEARAKEEIQRKKAGASLYYSRIAQSQLQWRVNDHSSARQSLLKCRPTADGRNLDQEDYRGWEWHYLQGLFHGSLFTLTHLPYGGLGGGVAFDPRNRWIVSVVGGHPEDETVKLGEVRIWDAKTGGLLHAFPGPGTLHRVAFRPDGSQFALATTDGSVLVWDALTGKELLRRSMHTQMVSNLVYHPDGSKIASASWDGTVKIWDSVSGKVLQELRGHTDKVQGVAFHPGGKMLASVSWDTTVRIWDVATGKQLKELRRHKRPVYSVAFSPDGTILASASRAGTLRIWDLASDNVIQTLTGDTGAVLSIAFSPDGRYVAKGGKDGTVRIWDLESGVERISFRGHAFPVEGVDFSPDCRRVVSVSPGRGFVKVWDLTRHPEYSTFARSNADLEAIAFHDDGKRLVSINQAGTVQSWDVAGGLLLEERTLPVYKETKEHAESPGIPVSFAPGGRLLAGRSLEDNRIVKIWDTANAAIKTAFAAQQFPVQCVRFSPDGRHLVICACDLGTAMQPHEVTVWDAAAGKRLAVFKGRGRIFTVAFNTQGDRLAWGDEGGSFSFVDWRTSQKPRKIGAHKTAIGALAFSRDGSLLASAGLEDRTVRIWKVDKLLTDGKKARHIVLPGSLYLCDLAFSPDGRRLAGISRDLVKVWEVDGGHDVLNLRGAPQRYWDPPFNPRVTFSPDGMRLAGTNWDETISIWDAPLQDTPEDTVRFQDQRRQNADQRSAFWHLQEAEHCLEHNNLAAANFHLKHIGNSPLPAPVQDRKDRLAARLAK